MEALIAAAEQYRAGSTAAAQHVASADHTKSTKNDIPPPLMDFQDKQGNSPAHLAARYGKCQALEVALNAPRKEGGPKEAVLQKNKAKMNVLHMAAIGGCIKCVELAYNPAPSQAGKAATRQGHTAGDVAERRGHVDIATAIKISVQKGSSTLLLVVPTSSTKDKDKQQKDPPTVIFAPPECLDHHTAPDPITRNAPDPPPENVNRLHVLTNPHHGILKADDITTSLNVQWDESSQQAAISDILRVHDWPYVRKIQAACASILDEPETLGHLDGDTAISHGTFKAALAAAGAMCSAVDALMSGTARNAFCAIRPPGHHAGPNGVVTSARDPNGSHGFCIFSNAAVAAAYAMNVYRHAGIQRVAILDFDVHHGNGTEACVVNAIPTLKRQDFVTPWSEGTQIFPTYKPWRDMDDPENIFFASVQGFGPKMPGMEAFVYPGSGATRDSRENGGEQETNGTGDDDDAIAIHNNSTIPTTTTTYTIDEDPDKEFTTKDDEENPPPDAPRVIDVGIPGFGPRASLWRRAWRDKILPALVKFNPDMIFISAGFDAHKKDEINFSYIGITEREYEWLTEQIVCVSNRCCKGRIVSGLEGGYRIQGGVVSAFSRSVAAHVKTMAESHRQVWDEEDGRWERRHEKEVRAEMEVRKAAAAEAEKAAREAAEARTATEAAAMVVEEETGGGGGGSEAAVVAVEGEVDGDDGGSRKRRRKSVDYVALNKKLEEEAAGGGGGK